MARHPSVIVADRMEPLVVRAMTLGWKAGQASVDNHALLAHAATGDVDGIYSALRPDLAREAVLSRVRPVLQAIFNAGADLAADVLESMGVPVERAKKRDAISVVMDHVNELAVAWAAEHAAELVVAEAAMKRAIRRLVQRSQAGKMTVDELAKKLKDIIGLDERRAAALDNFEAGLREEGLSESVIEARVIRRAEALRRDRAWTIARTETNRALVGGQIETWKQAFRKGLLDKTKMGKLWIVTDDDALCDECEELDGEVVGIDEEFSSGDDGPPLHPNCRCAVGLAPLEQDADKRLTDNYRRSQNIAAIRGRREWKKHVESVLSN